MIWKITISVLLAGWLSVVGVGFAAEQDYAARFKELQKQKTDTQIDPLLDEWRAQKPNDPDAWITSANYYFNQSVGPTISTNKPGKGDFRLTDKKTGKGAGSISFKPGVNARSHRATDLLQEATAKFPNRPGGYGWTRFCLV